VRQGVVASPETSRRPTVPYIVRIEHPVPSYEGWKQAFDADPIDREQSGVTRYRIVRDTADPSYVQIDLEFDERGEADAFHARLQELWERVSVVHDPAARVVEVVESHTYRPGRIED
jgi:hypothetical protein